MTDDRSSASGSLRRFKRRQLLGADATLGVTASLARPAVRSAAAADDLPIGWVLPMTGPLASSYLPHCAPAELAMQEINQAGGILGRKLVAVKFDDEGSPAKEPTVWRQRGQG